MKKKNEKEKELYRSKPRTALFFGSEITPSWEDKDESVDR